MKKVEISFKISKYADPDTEYKSPYYVNVHMLVNGKSWMLDCPVSNNLTAITNSKIGILRAGRIRAATFPVEIYQKFGLESIDLIHAIESNLSEFYHS